MIGHIGAGLEVGDGGIYAWATLDMGRWRGGQGDSIQGQEGFEFLAVGSEGLESLFGGDFALVKSMLVDAGLLVENTIRASRHSAIAFDLALAAILACSGDMFALGLRL